MFPPFLHIRFIILDLQTADNQALVMRPPPRENRCRWLQGWAISDIFAMLSFGSVWLFL